MTKQTNKTASTPTKPKKEVYISLNLDEIAALEMLGFRERWAYMALKRIASFKTGKVGEWGKTRLSYTAIAGLIKAPPGIQGRGEGRIDDTQARDFILRMEAVGLVSGIGKRKNGGLRFDLPMSPIDRNKAAPIAPCAGQMLNISPDEIEPEIADSPELATHAEALPPTQSVMTSQELKNNTDEAADPSGDGAASDRAFGATPCRAEGAAPVRENPRAVAGVPATLTAHQIHDALADCWTFTETGTPEAWRLYESWAGSVTLDDLQAAMIGVEETDDCPDPKPADLAPRLWPVIVDKHLGQPSA
jgi:hypothetical protein